MLKSSVTSRVRNVTSRTRQTINDTFYCANITHKHTQSKLKQHQKLERSMPKLSINCRKQSPASWWIPETSA